MQHTLILNIVAVELMVRVVVCLSSSSSFVTDVLVAKRCETGRELLLI